MPLNYRSIIIKKKKWILLPARKENKREIGKRRFRIVTPLYR